MSRAQSWDSAKWGREIERGERLLWFGQSKPQGRMDRESRALLIGVLVIGGVAGPLFTAIGLFVDWPWLGRAMFLGFAVAIVALSGFFVRLLLQEARQARKPVQYALTDRRALIRAWYGLESWPITPETVAEMRPGKPASVVFGREQDAPDRFERRDVPGFRDIGFFDIADAEKVQRLIRDIQASQPANRESAS